MQTWLLMEKLDNGYRARIVGWEMGAVAGVTDNINAKGREVFNRKFHPIPAGIQFEAKVDIKDSGRRFVGNITYHVLGSTTYHFLPEESEMPTPKVSKKTQPNTESLAGFYVSPEARLTFNTALKMLKKNPTRAVKVLVVGPSGYGKTSLPKLVAELTGMEFMRMNCATIRDPEEWFGYREAREGSTHFIRSTFANNFEKGNLVMVLDEFNRLEPWLHNTLFPLLDDDGATVVHDEQFTIGNNVLAVATINTGYKYTGTFELDEALVNRFDFVLEVGPLPHEEEVKVLNKRTEIALTEADRMVSLSTALRQSGAVCSIRTTLLMARMMASGMSMREAFDSAVIRRIPKDSNGSVSRKLVMDLINSKLGSMPIRTIPRDIFSLGEESEESATTTVAMLRLTARANEVGFVSLMKFIRDLPLSGILKPSMKQCREMAEVVRDGHPLTIHLREVLTNYPDMQEELESYGVAVTYEVMK